MCVSDLRSPFVIFRKTCFEDIHIFEECSNDKFSNVTLRCDSAQKYFKSISKLLSVFSKTSVQKLGMQN